MRPHVPQALAAVIALGLWGCSTANEYTIEPMNTAPSVAGTVEVESQGDKNYAIKLELDYLPMPHNLSQNMSTYVVWVNPGGTDQFDRVGHLDVTEDSRDAELRFTTTQRAFNVLVTAERNKMVYQPSNVIVVRQPIMVE